MFSASFPLLIALFAPLPRCPAYISNKLIGIYSPRTEGRKRTTLREKTPTGRGARGKIISDLLELMPRDVLRATGQRLARGKNPNANRFVYSEAVLQPLSYCVHARAQVGDFGALFSQVKRWQSSKIKNFLSAFLIMSENAGVLVICSPRNAGVRPLRAFVEISDVRAC